MSKKHFQLIATNFGYQLRFIDPENFDQIKGFWIAVGAFEVAAKELNPAFNAAKFEDWILDVFKKKRDLDGKKVK
jgi:hypothetical protein